MRNGLLLVVAAIGLGLGSAHAAGAKPDVFKGKLFPPNIILEHKAELDLSKEQFTEIRAAVVEVQSGVAEHEWDIAEAYQALMLELDKDPIDADRVLEYVDAALLAENEVKKKQVRMLIRLKNLLTAEQISYLESVHPK